MFALPKEVPGEQRRARTRGSLPGPQEDRAGPGGARRDQTRRVVAKKSSTDSQASSRKLLPPSREPSVAVFTAQRHSRRTDGASDRRGASRRRLSYGVALISGRSGRRGAAGLLTIKKGRRPLGPRTPPSPPFSWGCLGVRPGAPRKRSRALYRCLSLAENDQACYEEQKRQPAKPPFRESGDLLCRQPLHPEAS